MSFNYSPKIVTDGLVFAVDAANKKSYSGSGTTWVDLSGNQSNGILTNGPTFNLENGGYLSFDGTNDYIQVNSWDNTSTINTVEMWARWREGVSDMFMGFTTYDIWTDGGNLGFNTGAGDVYGISSTQVNNLNLVGTNIENWHHYIFQFTNQVQNNKIYIDGDEQVLSQQRNTTNLTATRSFSSSFRIGTWNNSTGYIFNGDISTVKIYNRELTQIEILQNYNTLKSRFGL